MLIASGLCGHSALMSEPSLFFNFLTEASSYFPHEGAVGICGISVWIRIKFGMKD